MWPRCGSSSWTRGGWWSPSESRPPTTSRGDPGSRDDAFRPRDPSTLGRP
jgi:hypothetical protein